MPSLGLPSIPAWVDSLQAKSRYAFRREEAIEGTGRSAFAVRMGLWRLVRKGRLLSPRRGFFVIFPLEYMGGGGLPANRYIHDLMAFLGQPYYVGLLSAAEIHGAAHQASQEFQIVTNRPVRTIQAGRARITFHVKRLLERTPVVQVKTVSGTIPVSAPEATALDVVQRPHVSGGLDNVATILAELGERLDPAKLAAAARILGEEAPAQRLGHLLDFVGHERLSGPLAKWLSRRKPYPVRLRPDRPAAGAKMDPKWLVLVNEAVESEA